MEDKKLGNPFRVLKANEIDVRIGTTSYADEEKKKIKGISCLLYKNARVDMALLNEVYGSLYWQRKHEFKDGKLYCSVGIYNQEIKEWVWKEDVGVESNAEAEKGQASDSFKRACFNFGLGIELYSSPFIWITPLENEKIKYTKFTVKHIGYDNDRKITELIIQDEKGNVRYEKYDREKPETPKKTTKKVVKEEVKKEVETPNIDIDNIDEEREQLVFELVRLGGNLNIVAQYYKKDIKDVTNEDIEKLINAKKKAMKKGN